MQHIVTRASYLVAVNPSARDCLVLVGDRSVWVMAHTTAYISHAGSVIPRGTEIRHSEDICVTETPFLGRYSAA
jgi:hypothetical protein